MAAPSISAFRAATREFERKRPPVAQLWFGTPLSDLISVEHITGDPIREQVKYLANSSGGFFAPDGNLDQPAIEQKYTQVEYDWKLATKSYALPKYRIAANAGSQQRLFDLWMEERLDAEAALREDTIDTELFSDGSNANGYQGLRKIALTTDTTTPLGKLSTADAPAWAGITDTTANTMSEAFLEESYQLTAWPGGREANAIVTTNALYTKYITSLAAKRRYESTERTWEGGVGKTGGWVPFHSAKLFKANACTASHVFFLQTEGPVDQYSHGQKAKWIYLAALKGQWFTSQDREYPMQETSERVSARVVAYGALVTSERRSQQAYTVVS